MNTIGEITELIQKTVKESFDFGVYEGLGQAYFNIGCLIDDLRESEIINDYQYNQLRKGITKIRKGEYKK